MLATFTLLSHAEDVAHYAHVSFFPPVPCKRGFKRQKRTRKMRPEVFTLGVLMCSCAKKEKESKPSMCPLPNWGFGGIAETQAN